MTILRAPLAMIAIASTLLVGSTTTLLVGSRPMRSHEVQATRDHDEV
jgi:hypothetical protein